MIRTISIVLASALLLGGCLLDEPPATHAASSGVCEAMRPSFPIGYHGGYHGVGGDSSDTARRIRVANARFAAACP